MQTIRTLAGLACVMAICASLHAQDAKLITVQLRDGKSGAPITPSNFLLRVDHFETVHNEWVKIYDNGTVLIRVPDDAKALSLQATYDSGMSTYINCDAAKQNNKEKQNWYPIDLILKAGVVAPNECGKTQYSAKPGEFIFFVRKRNALDRLRNSDAE
ncbi:MAG: hypothetical protein ABSD70_01670 [Terracidiphilus sp.]|jgi:hypothetical protein